MSLLRIRRKDVAYTERIAPCHVASRVLSRGTRVCFSLSTRILIFSLFITTLSPLSYFLTRKRRRRDDLSRSFQSFGLPLPTALSRSTGSPDASSDLEDRISDRLASSRIGSPSVSAVDFSHAGAPPPTPAAAPPTPIPVGLATALPPNTEVQGDGKGVSEKVDWLNLPCPVPFEEIQREALSESYSISCSL
ncbi:hypothetical protein BHE74_00000432 [Ensete ventricosum]|nr:hypothetical protein GW17_00004984 [Ensete ventricosum]RWW90502.1 hypothetical protein BHE74_00000432 [Ensete ventricosum]RZR76474.1 hypothetical protein BHM03_00001272 [Ensete ventricosum]